VEESHSRAESENRKSKRHSKDGKEAVEGSAAQIMPEASGQTAESPEHHDGTPQDEAELPEELPAEVPEEAPAEVPEEMLAEVPEDIEALTPEEVATLRREAEEYLEGWQRARAEFANYKRRTEREMAEIRQRVRGDMLVDILPIIDDLERALRDRPAEEEASPWASGIELIHRKLLALLEAEGVEEVETEGQQFDPTLHEALSHEESEGHPEGEIIDVLQKGYRMGERVLRPALVRVAK
jgi:molecular chaperone GrpE